ncbi:glycosyltransferase family 2 protein [Thermonema rossianum]|uniref:glycosyltransferase family 2 protein n=1 Tax=Thermonema rossianum TaxID=55505 RepID=UPI000689C739|nr:glycosyltransferase family A protein [Thermonema rossianum]
MEAPLVSVIALCHNHAPYLEQALWSVVGQTHPCVELLIVDDASHDASKVRIIEWMEEYYHECARQGSKPRAIRTFFFEEKQGNCRAFNHALRWAKGKYVIDFSTDDVLLNTHIEAHVRVLEQHPQAGVSFSNAWYIDEQGKVLGTHYPVDAAEHAKVQVPSGNVKAAILHSAFICTPTMVMRSALLHRLQGYDETLSYEDFDFWVRAASCTSFLFVDACTVMKRQLRTSHSSGFYAPPPNAHLRSTLQVTYKALSLCQTEEEYRALARRTFYHWRLATYVGDKKAAQGFEQVLRFPALRRHLSPFARIIGKLLSLGYWRPAYLLYRRCCDWLLRRLR